MVHRSMIGIFDSGVGGLSVLREVRRGLPSADFTYYGDTAHVPYGGKGDDEITHLTLRAVEVLKQQRPDLVVIACNTATSVAISTVREKNPKLPVVGVVPVLKTAAEHTKTKHVAVLATDATLKSTSYRDLKDRFAKGIDTLELALPEWVAFVEQGNLDGDDVKDSVKIVAEKVTASHADVVALGCTHFPFLRSLIEGALPGVAVLDSGPAVARQVIRVLTNNGKLPAAAGKGTLGYCCSGDPEIFSGVASKLLGERVSAEHVEA